MRFEIIDRQRLKHALLVAQFALALSAFGSDKPVLLVIGHPTAHGWNPPASAAWTTQVVDRDVEPRMATAYTTFAKILGVDADPVYVLATPHMEPFAAFADPSSAPEMLRDRDRRISDAGLAVRRYLLSGATLEPSPRTTPYDDIGGGFFRCATCFDKILSDQTRLAAAALEAGQHEIVRATLDFVLSDLQDRNGLFVAGQGSDSFVPLGTGPKLINGGHFVWSTSELRHLLGDKLAGIVIFHYRAGEGGGNVFKPRPAEETRAKFGLTEAELGEALATARQTLLAVRSKRPKPAWHTPIVTTSNAEMISLLARASIALSEPRYAAAALRAARALHPKTLTPAEHAALVQALFDTYQATLDLSVLEHALSLRANREEETVPEAVAALAPVKPVPAPSLDDFTQVVIAGNRSRDDVQAMIAAARSPGTMVFVIDNERMRKKIATWLPAIGNIAPVDGQPAALICEKGVCRKWSSATQPD